MVYFSQHTTTKIKIKNDKITGRVLEILLVLEQRWGAQHLSCYGVALLTKTAFNTCKFASSQLEWMNDRVIKVEIDFFFFFFRFFNFMTIIIDRTVLHQLLDL